MIVITGSIASGKSTVCKILKENGYLIVDADRIARNLINPEVIGDIFGSAYIKNGTVDRKALGALIFANPKEKEKLNAYIHPLIRQQIYHDVEKLEEKKAKYLVDIPLYFESGHYDAEIVAVVFCPKSLQIKRLMARDGMCEDDALMRIESQIDIEEKKKRADFVIDNSLDFAHVTKETKKFMEFLDARI
ncbi:dephospho-CoA kinase [Sulfurospirillum sp. 1612]|uniref:dephospho-CoA kinase n=1 Tax=Sulfurospirillum sp. 1612 TaxID=3094835 RepID=UPI002F91FBA9